MVLDYLEYSKNDVKQLALVTSIFHLFLGILYQHFSTFWNFKWKPSNHQNYKNQNSI